MRLSAWELVNEIEVLMTVDRFARHFGRGVLQRARIGARRAGTEGPLFM